MSILIEIHYLRSIFYHLFYFNPLLRNLSTGRTSTLSRALGRANLINSQQQASALNSGLDALQLNGLRLPNAILVHVDNLSGVAINTPAVQTLGVLRPELGEHSDGARTAVLHECSGNNLERLRHGTVRPLLDAFDRLRPLGETNGDGHLSGTTTGGEAGVEEDVACNSHGVVQISLHLIEDVLGRSAEEDGAGLGVLALSKECEVPGIVRNSSTGHISATLTHHRFSRC